MFKVEEAKKEDLEKIYSLELQLFKEKSWTYNMLAKELQNFCSQIWVLKKEEEVLGYLIFREILDEVDILRMGIKLEYQNQKLGTLFLNFF